MEFGVQESGNSSLVMASVICLCLNECSFCVFELVSYLYQLIWLGNINVFASWLLESSELL